MLKCAFQIEPIQIFTMKRAIIIFLFGLFVSINSNAQSAQNAGSTYLGFNVIHPILLEAVSHAMDKEVSYLPIHLTVDHSFTKHFGVAGLLMYRYEKDGEYFNTHELGFAAGPSYLSNSLKGFYANVKVGIGLTFGKDYNNSDYNRTDLILQPDLGYYVSLKSGLTFTLGIGMQSLLKLSESYYGDIWEWNYTGKLSHYYLPVVNFSVGYTID
jgi:hypothetical protein